MSQPIKVRLIDDWSEPTHSGFIVAMRRQHGGKLDPNFQIRRAR
jgi:hypothetical protein